MELVILNGERLFQVEEIANTRMFLPYYSRNNKSRMAILNDHKEKKNFKKYTGMSVHRMLKAMKRISILS